MKDFKISVIISSKWVKENNNLRINNLLMETIFIFAIRRPLKNPPLGLFKAILGRRHENKSKSFPKHAVRFLCDIYKPRYRASKLYDEDSWVLSNVESDWGPTLQPGPLYIFLFIQLIKSATVHQLGSVISHYSFWWCCYTWKWSCRGTDRTIFILCFPNYIIYIFLTPLIGIIGILEAVPSQPWTPLSHLQQTVVRCAVGVTEEFKAGMGLPQGSL